MGSIMIHKILFLFFEDKQIVRDHFIKKNIELMLYCVSKLLVWLSIAMFHLGYMKNEKFLIDIYTFFKCKLLVFYNGLSVKVDSQALVVP